MSFKEHLTYYMKRLNLTEKDIGNKFHVSISTVRRWVEGSSEPYRMIAELILGVLEKELYDNHTTNQS